MTTSEPTPCSEPTPSYETFGLLLDHLPGTKAEVWAQIEPHIVPGRELKVQYAFEDLWEAKHGVG